MTGIRNFDLDIYSDRLFDFIFRYLFRIDIIESVLNYLLEQMNEHGVSKAKGTPEKTLMVDNGYK